MKEKRDARYAKINQKMEELTQQVYDTTEAMKARDEAIEEKLNESIAKAKEKVNEVKENVKSYADGVTEKKNDALDKVKDYLEDVKSKIADKKEEFDKEMLERYIDKQLDYVDDCIELSLMLQAEAKLAFLEALDASFEYDEKYGE